MGVSIYKKPKVPALVWTHAELAEIVGEQVLSYELTEDNQLAVFTEGMVYYINPNIISEIIETKVR